MIYITTPCSRPENLEQISQSIPSNCKWIVLYDNKVKINFNINNAQFIYCPNTGFVGADGRNYFLTNYNINDDDWIYSLDDDNIIHPDFFSIIEKYLNKNYSIIHWGQLKKNNQIRLEPKLELNKIDAACFIIKWKYNKNIRYAIDAYNCDGIYAIDCSNNGPVLKLDQYICYYNYLRD